MFDLLIIIRNIFYLLSLKFIKLSEKISITTVIREKIIKGLLKVVKDFKFV